MDLPAEAQPIEISVAAENTEVLMPENLSHAEVSPAAPSAENPATDATKPQQSAASGAGGISKLDTLSREDLIKLVKKQYLSLKETKRQLEEAKTNGPTAPPSTSATVVAVAASTGDSQSVTATGKSDPNDALITMELLDYKSGLQTARRELNECRQQLTNSNELSRELTDRVAELTQTREEQGEQLKQLNSDLFRVKDELQDKTRTLTEHQKQMESLRIQLDESKSHAVENEGEMMNTVQELRRQLAQEQQYNRAKTNEFRRLNVEFEALQQQHNQLREEFNKYKQKAELVIRNSNAVAPADPSATAADENDSKHAEKHSTPSTETATPIISIKQANTEIQELIHTIQTRNATNSQLTSKCSMLEDELQRTMEYTRRLRSEIDSLNESLTAAQRMAFQERQRLCQDYEQRLKREEMAQNEFRQDLRATAERERAEAENRLQTISTKNESLLHENEKLKAMLNNKNQTPNASQQDQLTRFDTDSAEESVSRKQQQFDNKSVQKKKSITIANDSLALAGGRKHPPPLNFEMTMLSNQPHPMNTSSTTDLDVPSNSESSETYSSNEDLRSILNNLDRPELVSTPTNSAAKMPIGGQSSFGDSTEPPGLFSELSPERFEELNRQLADCNELLRDTEEENARLCEQVRVLKEEIRRLERNRERVEHIDGRNPERTEYFKNVVLKFLAPQNVPSGGVGSAGNAEPTDVRVHLLPVLQTMLQLSAEEMELIRESCDLPAVQSPTTATASNKNDANWKGFFGW